MQKEKLEGDQERLADIKKATAMRLTANFSSRKEARIKSLVK